MSQERGFLTDRSKIRGWKTTAETGLRHQKVRGVLEVASIARVTMMRKTVGPIEWRRWISYISLSWWIASGRICLNWKGVGSLVRGHGWSSFPHSCLKVIWDHQLKKTYCHSFGSLNLCIRIKQFLKTEELNIHSDDQRKSSTVLYMSYLSQNFWPYLYPLNNFSANSFKPT